MAELIREITNFLVGELTYHEAVPGGDLTAREMVNLRANENGHLAQRQPIRAVGEQTRRNITGIAASLDRLFFIDISGNLYFRNKDRSNQTDTAIPIKGRPRIITDTIPDGFIEPTKLKGRLSLIYEYKDFHIITSEGEDQAYWIDIRDEDSLTAYPLGFNPPTFEVTASALNNSGYTGFSPPNVFYRFTYVRDVRTPVEIENGHKLADEPFAEAESNPSDALLVQLTESRNGIRLNGIKFPNPDGLENGIAVYRSRSIGTDELQRGIVTAEDQDLDYRRVGIYPPTFRYPRDPRAQAPTREQAAAFDDYMTEGERTEQASLSFNNDRMPSTAKSVALYNDRIFAPNRTELRFSEIDFGNLKLEAFPKTNAIRSPVDIAFASEYREQLIFGGRNGLWRLIGNPPNQNLDRLSNIGPIDAYAATTTENVVGYITQAGLHFTDGITTEDISEPLQAYFENQTAVSGVVVLLPNGHSLWSVVFSRLDGSEHRRTFYRANQWQEWNNIDIEQGTIFEEKRVSGENIQRVVFIENSRFIRYILWENTEDIHDSRNTRELTPIAWKWKSQRIDFDREGIKAHRKRFTELIIQGKAEVLEEPTEITITFSIFDAEGNARTVTATRTLDKPFLYNTRVPIRRIGHAIQFEIEGTGKVEIASLCLKGNR